MGLVESFPSLKGRTATFDEFDKCESAGVLFGCLGNEGPIIHIYDVEKHCLDKQRIKNILYNFSDDLGDDLFLALKEELGLDE